MCGLAGILDLTRSTGDALLAQEVSSMARTLVHRGPDDADTWCDPDAGIGFGFQRLSIIDLSAYGKQPMASSNGRWMIAFNGEIYNHQTLRRELVALDHTFRGNSDTEVLIEAIAHWGLNVALGKLNGMFAIALWDRQERQLHLVRDRMGVKPLYWGKFGTNVIFASELKALRKSDRWTPRLDKTAESAFLKLGYIPAPLSIYGGIFKVLPGHGLTIDQDGNVHDWSYWSLSETIRRSKQNPLPAQETPAAFKKCFENAVRCRASADVPVGAFLSGGFDSTAVVAALVATGHADIETFSIGFDDPKFDESCHAKSVAEHLGVSHQTVKIGNDEIVQLAARLPHVYDEPFADSSQFPMIAVSEFARKSVTVALSGDGGDELFAGYTRHHWADGTWRRIAEKPELLHHGAGYLATFAPGALLKILPAHMRPDTGVDGVKWLGQLLSANNQTEFHERIVAIGDAKSPCTQGWFEDAQKLLSDPAERLMYTDAMRYLPDDILVKLDRASMSVGLEAREPFLDHHLLALGWSIPLPQKLESGIGKRVVRDYIREFVPDELMHRPKQGFSVPLNDWLRGPLRSYAEGCLFDQGVLSIDDLQSQRVIRLWKEHQSAISDHGPALWAHVVLHAWQKNWHV
jgi:asparagine synthase (glutamine-hydrolysing)